MNATLHEFQLQQLRKLLEDWPAGDIEFIVHAIKSYGMLLDTLKTVRELFKDGSSTQQMIDEAIAKAEND